MTAAQPTAVKRAAADHAKLLAQQQAEDDMRWLMADERGRRLVWEWLGGLFHTTHTGEALSSAFREGERNAALKLHAQVMTHAPAQFVRMLAEAQTKPVRISPGGVSTVPTP